MEEEEPTPTGHAVIKNGEVVEFIRNGNPPTDSKPVFVSRPQHYPQIEELSGPSYEILADKVNASYTRVPKQDALKIAKEIKVKAIREEGLRRIKEIYPAIASIDTLILLRDFINSVAPEARNLVANLQTVNSIYQAALDAIAFVKSQTDSRRIMAYNVKKDPAWP